MKCIYCGCLDSRVVDSRISDDGSAIRRRRECTACLKRFTTYEKVEDTPIYVIKNNHNRQVFDAQKIKNGILKIYKGDHFYIYRQPEEFCKTVIDFLTEE